MELDSRPAIIGLLYAASRADGECYSCFSEVMDGFQKVFLGTIPWKNVLPIDRAEWPETGFDLMVAVEHFERWLNLD